MPFAYRLRKPAAPPGRHGEGRTTLLVCRLGDKAPALPALKIAAALDGTTRRDVVLISDQGACRAVAAELGLTPLDRLMSYDLLVVQDTDADVRLSPRMIGLAASLRLASTRRIGPNGGTRVYARPRDPAAPRALFVFPGMFAPPRIGSHQRAFSTVLDLIEAGYDVDLLVKGGRELNPRSRNYLALMSPRIETYEVADPPSGDRADLSHEQREAADVDADARALAAAMLAKTAYEQVVVSFPWITSILPDDIGGASLACDTHDVVSNRRREIAGGAEAEALAARERDQLARCDVVLAISPSDAELFRTRLGLPDVVVHPMSYYPNEAVAEWRAARGPLRFGFLGTDMEANRRALKLVMADWWPAIEAFSPESRITIAGTIARSPGVSPYVILRDTVTVAGFVDDLGAFFASIDVLLAPTLVQAGVNIKNVEALLCRRVVVTNTLGARSLAPLALPSVCDTTDELMALIRKLDRNEPQMLAALETSFDAAAAHHAKPRAAGWPRRAPR